VSRRLVGNIAIVTAFVSGITARSILQTLETRLRTPDARILASTIDRVGNLRITP